MTTSDEVSAQLVRLGIGRASLPWLGAVFTTSAVAIWGIFAYSQQLQHGLITSGLRTIGEGGATWGLYVAFDVYFVGVSFAGISVAALVRLFSLEELKPLTRIAELLTIVSLLMGGLCIVADLGRPLEGLLNLPRYARPLSPFFGTFTLVVAGYLFASLVYFWLAGRPDAAACAEQGTRFHWVYRIWASGHAGTAEEHRRHQRSSFWLSLFILPLLIAAHSTLGFVFGVVGGRPGWFSGLQAPAFVVLAASSGLAMLTIVVAVIRRALALEDVITESAFRLLGNFLWVTTLVYLYFMVIDELTSTYASSGADARVAHAIVAGPYAWMFWTVVASFVTATVALFLQFVRGQVNVGMTVAAAVLINVASILKRLLIVVPSQTQGMLLSYELGSYVPSWVEVSVVSGLFAIAALLMLLFARLFPIVPIVTAQGPEVGTDVEIRSASAARRQWLRAAFFWLTLVTGLALSVVGFLLSLRFGTLPFLDPVVPYSPVLFIVGVMVTFYSAAIYETLPLD